MDGVVANTHAAWLDLYNADYDDDLDYSEITDWDMAKFVKPECGRKIYEYLTRPDFYELVVPMDYSLLSMDMLREMGHRIIFVSAGFFPAKVEWLHNYGFLKEYPYNDGRWQTAADIIIAYDKNLINGDILIDDRTDNVLAFDGQSILFNQPWNLKDKFGIRVDGWMEIVDILRDC